MSLAFRSRIYIAVAVVGMADWFVGCAKINDVGLRLVSTKTDAYAIVKGQVLSGNVTLVPDRTGHVTLGTDPDAATSCAGGLRFTAVNSGLIDLHCGDGSDGQLNFSLLSDARGYAYGLIQNDPVSLVFGLSDQDAPAYLRPPAGRRLVVNEQDGGLLLK